MSRIKTLIVDDQELFASGIEIMLQGPGKEDFCVVGKARDGREAIDMVRECRPDIVLMDVRMPNMDGVEATRIIHKRFPDAKVLILTTFDDDQYVLDALDYGASGYILKDMCPADLLASMKAVCCGNLSVSASVGEKLVQRARYAGRSTDTGGVLYRGEVNYLMACFDELTLREAEILNLLMLDQDNHEIASQLLIAEQTVKNRISTIYGKLGVRDRVHAKRYVRDTLARHPTE